MVATATVAFMALGCGGGPGEGEGRGVSADIVVEIDENALPTDEWCRGRVMDAVVRSGYSGQMAIQIHDRWPPNNFDVGSSAAISQQYSNGFLMGGFFVTLDKLPEKHMWFTAYFHPRKSKLPSGAGLVGESLLSVGLCGGSCLGPETKGGVSEADATGPDQHFSVRIRLNFPYYTEKAAACP